MEGPLPPNDCPKLNLCKPLSKLVGSSKTKKNKHLIESLTKPNGPKTYDSQNQKPVKPKTSMTKSLPNHPKDLFITFHSNFMKPKKTSQKFLS
jgi:hypothetical protein